MEKSPYEGEDTHRMEEIDWPRSHWLWYFLLISAIVLFFDRGLLALGNIFWLTGVAILLGWRSTLQLFTNRRNYKGFTFIPSWYILYICSLASSWYSRGNIWMLCPFWWFLALNQGVSLSDSCIWLDFTLPRTGSLERASTVQYNSGQLILMFEVTSTCNIAR
ncbi:UNVERIFIED_CONTAM: hypothetical protein Scaly_1076600 [Sesamum calycinum]|uniref:Uncharacterized protein n=1 Tax=Sesamum calycinum TaxID=2727403 RepID=A0AAW2QKX1_9LAMI